MSKAEFPLLVAAIDMGSNALRLVAAEFIGPDEYRVIDSQRIPVRLGRSIFQKGRLKGSLMKEAVQAVAGFRERMDTLGVHEHRAVATSAVRESRNGDKLRQRILRKTGIRVEAISGAEEGRLVWRALRSRVDVQGKRWLLVDIGGGSVEISLVEGEALLWTESLPLGAVRLLERLGEEIDDGSAALGALIEQHTRDLNLPERSVDGIIATGGNADALAEIADVSADGAGMRRVPLDQLRQIISRITPLSCKERIEQLNLREDRADVILPAAVIFAQVATQAGTESIVVPGMGLKEGVLLDLVDNLLSDRSYAERHRKVVEEGAIDLGRRYGFDEAHALHVSQQAVQLFDALRALHGMREEDRRTLTAAALLHDVGKVIATRRHHKHSRYLIRHAELPGLGKDQTELVSLVARYHRGSKPKRSHGAYGKLEAADRKRVKQLIALLRVADGLDNEHEQRVVLLSVAPDPAEVVLKVADADGSLLESRVMKRKGRLFERVFKRQLRLIVAHHPVELST